jgi:hypothetical protein
MTIPAIAPHIIDPVMTHAAAPKWMGCRIWPRPRLTKPGSKNVRASPPTSISAARMNSP